MSKNEDKSNTKKGNQSDSAETLNKIHDENWLTREELDLLNNRDASGESLSLSQESTTEVPVRQALTNSAQKRVNRRSSEWEIIEGLRDGQRYETKPEIFTGYLHKKRKWPLKGWHKRYFVVDTGILKYGKSPNDVTRGKIHGSVDIALSVISTKSKRKRIDIDAEEFIYHLKAKQYEIFEEWVEQLKRHRLYRQHLLNFGVKDALSISVKDTTGPNKLPLTRKLASEGSPPSRLQWVMESGPMQVAVTELNHTQQALVQLGRILEQLEISSTEPESTNDGFSPNVKKDRKKFGLRKKKPNKGSSVDLTVAVKESESALSVQVGNAGTSPSPIRPSTLTADHHIPISASTMDMTLASDYYILAKDVYTSLKSVVYTIHTEKDRLKSSPDDKIKSALTSALRQNADLRLRLSSISRTSDLADLPDPRLFISNGQEIWDFQTRILNSSLSRSSCASEFYDAEEGEISDPPETGATSDASSIAGSSEDGASEGSSEISDMADSEYNETQKLWPKGNSGGTSNLTGRRSKLPASSPDTQGLSLWNLLSKNIGKDLSQISMPVGLSHPLNVLQRLCEDLEYSDLLDKAAEISDPVERMILVAAFAVSSYSSGLLRAGSKPFNPLLGETYEAIREDRGFRFISEQVSHHPPVSACHAESKNFVFWQDIRIKTKFWGKSMEFQPAGKIYLELLNPSGKKDLYEWNKVTACVHNLFSDTRWLEQYGTLTINNDKYTCQIDFIRASYFSPQRYELHGSITDLHAKKEVVKLFGKWNEALYVGEVPSARCIWRPGTMPIDYQLYYGFTRFAIELNELQPDMVNVLPCTDTRFRPDQRLLEEGNLEEAEKVKLQVEQSQRERRKKLESEGKTHVPKWFKKVTLKDKTEVWEFVGQYWEKRKNPGFVNMQIEPIW